MTTSPKNPSATIAGIFIALVVGIAIASEGDLAYALPFTKVGMQIFGVTLIIVGVLDLMRIATARKRSPLSDNLTPLTIVLIGSGLASSSWVSGLSLAILWSVALYLDRPDTDQTPSESD
ncbi:MAG: hypothetical protein ACJAZ8_002220 [Planctomycetota bacterium]|jgi:hypothetical protein